MPIFPTSVLHGLIRAILLASAASSVIACGDDADAPPVADMDSDEAMSDAGVSDADDPGSGASTSGETMTQNDDRTASADTREDDAGTDREQPNGQPLKVTFLHVNDIHSHLEAETFDFPVSDLDLSTKADETGAALSEVQITYGGMPLLKAQFDALTSAAENVIKLNAGDVITGTLYYSLFNGEADAALMNDVCFDALALGNHEFDDGDQGLATFLDHLAVGACGTPVLAANVVPGANSAVRAGYLEPYTILDVGGQQLGVIGIDVAGKTKNSSRPDADTEFLDEAQTAQIQIDALALMGIDKIILLTHYGFDNDLELAAAVSGVDLIVGGDSHTLLGAEGLSPLDFPSVGDYPTKVTDRDGNPVCLVHAWEYGHLLGKLDVEFDAEGTVTACAGAPVVPISGSYHYTFTSGQGDGAVEETRVLEGADQLTVTEALSQFAELVVTSPDAESQAILDGFKARQGDAVEAVIGHVDTDLCLVRWPGESRSAICDRTATYERGSDISNLVAKAFLLMTPTADIGIQNAGGVRVDVAAGDYTIADAYALLPFNNTLVTLQMSGAEIIAVLEDALANHLDADGSSGSYPYASGLRYDVDASAAFGSRISNVEVNPRVAGDWEPIGTDMVYTVVTNDFIASGQDGYDTFQIPFDEGRYEDTLTSYAQGFMDFVQIETTAGRSLGKLPADEYSTQTYVGRDGCNHSMSAECIEY